MHDWPVASESSFAAWVSRSSLIFLVSEGYPVEDSVFLLATNNSCICAVTHLHLPLSVHKGARKTRTNKRFRHVTTDSRTSTSNEHNLALENVREEDRC